MWLDGTQTQLRHFAEDTKLLPLPAVNPWIIQLTVQSLFRTFVAGEFVGIPKDI
jgi:hypothetical protein